MTEEIQYLSKDMIKKSNDREIIDIEVEEWDGIVGVRPLTMYERRAVRENSQETKRKSDGTDEIVFNMEVLEIEAMIFACVSPKFERADMDWLMEEKSSGAISKISKVIFDISGLGAQVEKKIHRKNRKRS